MEPGTTGDEIAAPENIAKNIFDERFQAVMNGFSEACQREGITVAVAIAIHPDEARPLVYIRGHMYDATAIAARIVKDMKNELISDLE